VPGPHVLNGALDLIYGRIHLGAARLIYAGLIIIVISTGLLIGLALLGVSLPVDQVGRAVPLWQDVIAAGVAVASYGIFFSMPFRTEGSPKSPVFGLPVRLKARAPALRGSRDISSARRIAADALGISCACPAAMPSSVLRNGNAT
jgi:hypothetical protein